MFGLPPVPDLWWAVAVPVAVFVLPAVVLLVGPVVELVRGET